jgi:esterase/lipase superfamily enzyme
MGGWLAVEALRQLRLAGRDEVLDRIEVILAAPDIDVDVFRGQMDVIGPLRHPMTILVSSDDRALRISSRIAGKRPRLGALDVSDPRIEPAAVKANVRVIDISALDASDALKHDRYVAVASLYPRVAGAEQSGGIRHAGAFVFNAIGATLSSPFTLAGRVIAGE